MNNNDTSEKLRGADSSFKAENELEKRVEERTCDLIRANQKLQREVREHKQVAEKIAHAKKEWEQTFDTVPDLIAIIDRQHRIIRINRTMAEKIGVKPGALIGEICYKHFHGMKAPPNFCPHSKLLSDGREHKIEIHNEHLGADFLVTASPFHDTKGQLIGSVHVARDISGLKQVEAALQKAHADLEKRVAERTTELSKTNLLLKREINAHAISEQKAKSYVSDLRFLSETAMGFVGLSPDKDIYQFICERLKELVGDSIVIACSFDKVKSIFNVRAIQGIDKYIEKVIKILGKQPVDIISKMNDETARIGLTSGKLVKVPGGLFELSFKQIPEQVSKALEKLLGLESIFVMGFAKKNELFGDAIILNRESTELKNQSVIETFVNQASVALQRKQAEDQIKASLKEKELLLRELHHRVKNNLQVISSLIYLQSQNIRDKHVQQIFNESYNRVKSMAFIHEKLYKSKDLTMIDFADYAQSLVNHLFRSYEINSTLIKLTLDVNNVVLNINAAVSCGMIINELVSNSLKHAFSGDRAGEIFLELFSEGAKKFTLIVGDDGVGFPGDIDFRNTKSLGLKLVCNLTEQLEGTIELDRSKGTLYKIKFAEAK